MEHREYVEKEILISKSKILDFKNAIENEENKLRNLHGALETLQMIEAQQKNTFDSGNVDSGI